MRKTSLTAEQLLHSVHMEKSYLGWLPGVVQQVTHVSKLPHGNEKLVNSYRDETMH